MYMIVGASKVNTDITFSVGSPSVNWSILCILFYAPNVPPRSPISFSSFAPTRVSPRDPRIVVGLDPAAD